MAFDWREFLIIAHELRNDHREAAQRTSLGRIYYYVYNVGLIKARTLSFSDKPPSLHRKLWKWCQGHADPRIRTMGMDGLRMLSLRHAADYETAPIRNLAGEVKRQLTRAQVFEELMAQTNNQQPPDPLPV